MLLPPTFPASIPSARFAARVAASAFPQPFANQPYSLLGLPCESGIALNAGKPGASLGPDCLRAALAAYGVAHTAAGPLPSLYDAGDVAPPTLLDSTTQSLEKHMLEMHSRVAAASQHLAASGSLPIAIGGSHDLTFPFVKGVVQHHRSKEQHRPLAILNFDAHLDVRETLGSGMPFRAINESLSPIAMATVGMNPFANTREHADYFTSQAHGSFLTSQDHLTSWLSSLPSHCMLAVSFDVDVLDASAAPGVSARNPAGLSVHAAATLLSRVMQDSRVICLDFEELSPPRDTPPWTTPGNEPGTTARAVAHLLLTALAARHSLS